MCSIEHVASTSHGEPLDSTLRVTLNFHPARPHAGTPLLQALARHVIGYAARDRSNNPQLLKQVWHCIARFG